MALNDQEREELIRLARSSSLKEDMRQLAAKGPNPLMVNGRVDVDRWLMFLNEYNEFMSHISKPFHTMIDRFMKL